MSQSRMEKQYHIKANGVAVDSFKKAGWFWNPVPLSEEVSLCVKYCCS